MVSLLTMIGIMGVAFAFSMYLETQATREFISTIQARYIAECGISHARALLDEDRLSSRTDDLTESWAQAAVGSEVDVDGDGSVDAKWWLVQDAAQRVLGRYAVKLVDEAGKANLNAAQAAPPAFGVGGINLTRLLEEAGVRNAQQAAQVIERYRYGPDGRPGRAGIDDDGDGTIDEDDEYQLLAPLGDDRRLEALEELVSTAGLSAQEVRSLGRLATVYSWDANVSVDGKPRINVNAVTAVELVPVLLEAGVADPWQAAANIADDADADLEMSRVTKSAQPLAIMNQGTLGGWAWTESREGHYESRDPSDAPLVWTVPVPTGTFHVRARGLSGMKIGDVTVANRLKPSADDGESFGVLELRGTLTVTVADREPAGTACAFRGIELVPETSTGGGVAVRGIEAVRFNELMVEPTMTLSISSATFDPQGSGWVCPVGSDTCLNSGAGQGRWSWTNGDLASGRYYVRVLAAAGQTVGEVRIDGNDQLLGHGQTHSSPVTVGSDGKISLAIGKTSSEETYYLKGIVLSLQPDGEYAELINLSGAPIDASGWTIGGELTGGREARLPSGSVLKPHGLLVAAVDLDDTQTGLAGNGISARAAWEIGEDVTAVQLEFPGGPPSIGDDWLKTAVPAGSVARLTLRSGTAVVDEVQYPLPPPTTASFQSLEKGDPTVIVDGNLDGIDEGWHPALALFTPGLPNDNNGMQELVGVELIRHDPAKEITLLNHPLNGVGELAGVSSGTPWKPLASADLAKIVDRLTVEGHRLEVEGRWAGAAGERAWQEKTEGYALHTDPAQADVAGRWQWTDLTDGEYRLSLLSCEGCDGEELSVRWERRDGGWTAWSPALATDAQGRIAIGRLVVGLAASSPQPETESTPPRTLTLEVACASRNGICHLDAVRLDPQLIRVGPVNVNTASGEVLLALPGMTEALASRIIAGRPYGDRDQKGRGIGDLLLGDILGTDERGKLEVFQRIAHLLTTRSDVFQIQSLGQAAAGERVNATQRILTVIQRR